MGTSPHLGGAFGPVHKLYGPGAWVEGRAEDQLAQVAGWAGMRAVAAFPDLHPGRHGPVGAAFLADRIYPQLVGPDIGCGMALFRLSLPQRKLKADKALRRLIALDDGPSEEEAAAAMRAAGLEGSATGLGTIGGGNHFCEIQVVHRIQDQAAADAIGLNEGDLCLLVHSGSRSLGSSIFLGSDAPSKDGYAAESEEARTYLTLHDKAVAWAALNRRMIAQVAADALRCEATPLCDAVHNHVEADGDLWLHRKGAAKPDRGWAPLAGSRETESFLMRIEDAPEVALGSVSHGAGRKHDRASMHGRIRKNRSSIAEMSKTPFGGTVVCADPDLLIEEAGKAYKDPEAVMADLEHYEVARRALTLRPLLTYKTGRTKDDR